MWTTSYFNLNVNLANDGPDIIFRDSRNKFKKKRENLIIFSFTICKSTVAQKVYKNKLKS